MKRTIVVAVVLALIALTGCAPKAIEFKAAPETMPAVESVSSETVSATPSYSAITTASPSATQPTKGDAGQVWADKMINLFLNGNSKSKFSEFNDEIPHHYITEWSQESEGVMSVTVSGDKWTQCDMDELAVTVMSTAGQETPEMKKVVTYSDNKGLSGSTDRKGMNFGTPESC